MPNVDELIRFVEKWGSTGNNGGKKVQLARDQKKGRIAVVEMPREHMADFVEKLRKIGIKPNYAFPYRSSVKFSFYEMDQKKNVPLRNNTLFIERLHRDRKH